MYEVKLIALDLDGTTLNSKSCLTEKTKKTLERALEEGVHVVISTGRTYCAVPEAVKNIKGLEFICTSNGAEIRDLRNNSTIYSNYLKSYSVKEAVRILKDEDFMIEIFVDGIAYTDSINYDKAVRGVLGFRNQKYVVDTRNPVDDIYSFALENCNKIENINVNFIDINDRERMKAVLEGIEDVTVTSSFDYNWEIGGKTTSKADALKHLCEIIDVQPENVMAVGDSPNDSAMLSFAGIPVAVGNAKDIIKKQAVFVAPSNDEDGVSAAIEKLLWNLG